jgi:two-component system, OmpR family, sensor histidine kinase CpxA
VGPGICMRSLFLKILLCSFLAVVVVAIVPGQQSLMPPGPAGAGGVLGSAVSWAVSFLPILAVGISGLICVLLARHITEPLVELRRGAETIALGNLTARVPAALRHRRDEIGDLGRDFDRMAERLEWLVERHKRLLYDVSHELRSPLARLTVAVGLARRSHAEEMPELLDRIALEAERLDNLIGELLTLARIESSSHAAAASSIDLTALVHDVVTDADFEARAQTRRAAVTAFEECTVSGSEELLRSAVENVVRNGIRFTREGTAVDVSLRRERDRAVIRVRDRGPGVPDTMLSEIFLPFHRSQAMRGTRNDGSGLGLAIAHRAVAANGGTIRAMNGADGGLIVDIEVPFNPEHFRKGITLRRTT